MCSLPDGSLFSSGGSRSTDGGETWTSFEVPLALETEIRINANGIYFLDFNDRLWKSQDNGESFEFVLFDTGVNHRGGYQVSINEQVYSVRVDTFMRYNFDGEVVDVIPSLVPDSRVSSYVTAFNTGQVFFLLNVSSGNPKLMVYDEASTLSELKSLPVSNRVYSNDSPLS